MKKIILVVLALSLVLASCVATKVDEEKLDDLKNEVAEEQKEAIDLVEGELPWIGEPQETPMIPADLIMNEAPEIDESEVVTPSDIIPDKNELPLSKIIPEENETPAIPLN